MFVCFLSVVCMQMYVGSVSLDAGLTTCLSIILGKHLMTTSGITVLFRRLIKALTQNREKMNLTLVIGLTLAGKVKVQWC